MLRPYLLNLESSNGKSLLWGFLFPWLRLSEFPWNWNLPPSSPFPPTFLVNSLPYIAIWSLSFCLLLLPLPQTPHEHFLYDYFILIGIFFQSSTGILRKCYMKILHKNPPRLYGEVNRLDFQISISGHFQKCKETQITVKEKNFSVKLFSSVSIIPSSINLWESSYTCQIKFLFSAMIQKFSCWVAEDSNWTCGSES